MDSYMSHLNTAQLAAVTKINGPVLIVAGAGTGKTRTITSRIAHILEKDYAHFEEILAVTFTNKAANEMRSRILEMSGKKLPWLGTFHSIAAKILRRHAAVVGLIPNFVIIDMDDQVKIVKDIMRDLSVQKGVQPKIVLNIIQKWKERCLEPSEVTVKNSYSNESIALKVYQRYQARLMDHKSVDFGDLLFYNIKLFKLQPNILLSYQKRFKYIMVDEYQDTNAIQYSWLKYLSRLHSNICCVGDDDQSIYSWRGAEVENILKFSDDFKAAETVKLECNYRSTSHILSAAWHIIKSNKNRLEKKLWTTNTEGDKVNLIKHNSEIEEADFISEQIAKLNQDKFKYSDIAILVRAAFLTRVIEESFVRHSVPYKILCGLKFYERQEIKDIIAYLRLIVNHNDNLAFDRIVNRPKRSIGDASLKKIQQFAQDNKMSHFDAARALINNKKVTGKTKNSLDDFLIKIETWNNLLAEKPLKEVVETIVNESGYLTELQKEEKSEIARIENVKELIASLNDYDDVLNYLEHISLVTDVDTMGSGNVVCVLTLHGAKGLEFPCVFLPAWEEDIFPNARCISESGLKGLEEERRLAYVGITRAKEKLFISHAKWREGGYYSSPQKSASRFIQELPRDHIHEIKVQGSSNGSKKKNVFDFF